MTLAVSQQYPTLNGNAPSWTDIIITLNVSGGVTVRNVDIKSIKWSTKVERGEQRGASGGRVLKRTTGSVTHEGSWEIYKSGLKTIVGAISAAPGVLTRGSAKLISVVDFDISIAHDTPGDPDIVREVMQGCRLSSFESSMTEGDDAEIVPMDLAPIRNYMILADGTIVELL